MAEIIGRVGWRNYVSPISPLWNNLVAYYTGDNTPNDAKGTYNGTLVNGATYATGKINNGFSFDGVNDYVSLPDGTFNPTSGDYSISQWINSVDIAVDSYRAIFGLGSVITSNSIVVYLYNNAGSTKIRFLNSNNTTYQFIESTIPSFNSFHHVCCIKNTTDNKYYLYVNGALVAQATITVNYVPNILTTKIGNFTNGYFMGKIDEVGLWSRALTATEVAELYNAGAGKQYVAPVVSLITTGLVMNLDASNALSYTGTGTSWTDLSGGGNNGTLLNGTSYSSENGGTLVLDGINDYVKINNGTGLNLGNEYTFSIWVKFNNFNAVLAGADMWDYYYLMYVGDSNNIYTSGAGGYALFSGLNITTNQWVCLTIVRSAASNTLYKNGVYIASGNPSNSGIVKAIGAYAGGSFNLNGKISSVNAYNRSLSSTEVTQNFNATKTRFGL